MYYISIDVGIINLGLIGATINDDYTLDSIELCDVIDIRELIEECDENKCNLHHDKCNTDYMNHFFVKFKKYFDKADKILVERQPPGGLICIQDLIMNHCREKVSLISPNAMHKHFDIGHHAYKTRKVYTVKFSMHLLKEFKIFLKDPERSEHMADALCLLRYYLYEKEKEYREQKIKEKWEKTNSTFLKNMESYRYIPPKKNVFDKFKYKV